MEKKESSGIKVQIEVEVEHEWLDCVLNYPDMFGHDYCGYWARGVQHQKKAGSKYGRWLVWENAEKEAAHGEEPNRKQAVIFFKTGVGSLPEDWHIFDTASISRAWAEGVKRFGVNWYDNPSSDANTYDVAIQLGVLGEVRYG